MTKMTENGEMEIGFGPFKITLSGRLAKQTLVLALIGGGAWMGYHSIILELEGMRFDIIKTQITAQAIVEALPVAQQKLAKSIVDNKMAVLKLADPQSQKEQTRE